MKRGAICLTLLFAATFLIGCGGGGGDNGGGEKPAPDPTISITGASVNEGDSGTINLTFTISLSAVSETDVIVDYATSNISATAGSDYTAASGRATITAGNLSTTVSVSVMGDITFESDETFTLTLSNASGAALATAMATGTIINDDIVTGGPFMLYGDPDSGNLYAVDINDPSLTYPVDSGITGNGSVGMGESEMIITGDIDVGMGVLNNFRPDTFVYFNAGRFWRVDLKAGSNLTPTQISNVDSGYVCRMDVLDNVITPADSYIVFAQGADAQACASTGGQSYVIQVGDDSSVVPTSIPGGPHWGGVDVETMETGATPGQVTGFLVRESYPDFSVTRYDISFSNPAVLLDGDSQALNFSAGERAPDGVSFYLVDNILYSYTHDLVDTTVTTMHTFPAGSSIDSGNDVVCNMTHCYFVQVNDTTDIQSLYLAAIDGSGSSLIGTAFNDDDILGLSLTSGRLYINTTPKAGGGQSLNAVSVSGGTPAEVDSITTGYFTGMIGVSDILYYNKIDESTGMTISATVLKDDDTVAVSPIANAAWVGFVLSNAQVNTVFEPSEFVLAEDVTGPAGHRFTTYNAAAATVGTVIGTLEGSFFLQNPFAAAGIFTYGIGDTIIGRTTFGTESNYQTDVIMGNKTIVDSLQKVTDTATVSELPAL